MRGKSSVLKLVLFLLLAAGAGGAVAESLGTISGSVATSGVPARVTIVCGGVTKTVMTDPAGNFTVGGLPAGACSVSASATGHAASAASVTVRSGSISSVSLRLGSTKPADKPTEKSDESERKQMPKADPAPAKKSETRTKDSYAPAAVAPAPAMPMRMAKLGVQRVPGGPLVQHNADPASNTETYDKIDDNPFRKVSAAPLSTFSVDVDTAAYANMRRFVAQGNLPPKDAVRIEEMINYFSYDYPQPEKGEPFSITTDVTQSPFNPAYKLARIGLKAPAIQDAQVPARNLVFLLDVSGSMNSENKLPLLKQAMNLLVAALRPQDSIAIVTYAGNAGLVLPATSGAEKDTIRNAIFGLEPGGGTNGSAGIQLAYEIAERVKGKRGGINRIILATDGDFNIGNTDQGSLTRLIEEKREKGVFLTVLGFGMGNYKDSTLEKLADKGNGNHAYIDTLAEARKVLVSEAGATLVTVAKDVKLQVEFNPNVVAGYRLIGYENRMLRDEDFNDDKKDAGDIGAGHSVTALYEIIPAGVAVPGGKVDDLKYQTKTSPSAAAAGGELMTVKIRYKQPDGKTSKLLQRGVVNTSVELAKAPADLRWATAIAGFGMMLRESPHRGNLSWKSVIELAEGAVGSDAGGYRKQAVALIKRAQNLR